MIIRSVISVVSYVFLIWGLLRHDKHRDYSGIITLGGLGIIYLGFSFKDFGTVLFGMFWALNGVWSWFTYDK